MLSSPSSDVAYLEKVGWQSSSGQVTVVGIKVQYHLHPGLDQTGAKEPNLSAPFSNKNYPKKITCEFYRVELEPTAPATFEKAIEQIEQHRPKVRDRNVPIEGGYSRIMGWQRQGNRWQGLMLRLRTDNAASIGRLDVDDLRELSLDTDEALTESFCFAYYPDCQVLVVHRNRDAGGVNRLQHYFERTAHCGVLRVDPILNTDVLNRLQGMHFVSSVELQVATPSNLSALDDGNTGVNGIINLSEQYAAASVTVRLSMVQTKRSMRTQVTNLLQHAIGMFGPHVKTAKVEGRSTATGEEKILLDLIEDHMKEQVTWQSPQRRLTPDEVFQALDQAYVRREREIDSQFRTLTNGEDR